METYWLLGGVEDNYRIIENQHQEVDSDEILSEESDKKQSSGKTPMYREFVHNNIDYEED